MSKPAQQKNAPATTNGNTSATETEKKGPDKKVVLALFEKAFQAEKLIEEAEKAVKVARKEQSAALAAILEATNGYAGPFDSVHGRNQLTIVKRTLKGSEEVLYHLREPGNREAMSLG